MTVGLAYVCLQIGGQKKELFGPLPHVFVVGLSLRDTVRVE
jgi:hypothetical protein